jgi:hypothetical protein
MMKLERLEVAAIRALAVLILAVIALTWAAWPAHADAGLVSQTPPCVAGGQCCTQVAFIAGRADERCGTLAQFQTWARVVCLQWKAIERPTLAQTVDGWGRCHGAKAAAENVAAAQRVNGERAAQAHDAQAQLRAMGITPRGDAP